MAGGQGGYGGREGRDSNLHHMANLLLFEALDRNPKRSGSENKNGTVLHRDFGGDSTNVISEFRPYWSAWSELAQSLDLFAQDRDTPFHQISEMIIR